MVHIPERCWQVAAGDSDRNYADICIKHGVVLMGPGCGTPWYEKDLDSSILKLKNDNWSTNKINNITKFAHDIKENDLVVLRLGRSTVCAVGYVRSSYFHNSAFDDVDGGVCGAIPSGAHTIFW